MAHNAPAAGEPSRRKVALGYLDFTSPENPATANRLSTQPTTAWKLEVPGREGAPGLRRVRPPILLLAHFEQVRERKREAKESEPPDYRVRADLVPLHAACAPATSTSAAAPRTVRVTVHNQGAGGAAASHTIVDFGPPGKVVAQTPALAAGMNTIVSAAVPSACPQTCAFEVLVDGAGEVEETDEANNTRTGTCPPPG